MGQIEFIRGWPSARLGSGTNYSIKLAAMEYRTEYHQGSFNRRASCGWRVRMIPTARRRWKRLSNAGFGVKSSTGLNCSGDIHSLNLGRLVGGSWSRIAAL